MRNLLIISDTHHDITLMEELIKKYKGYIVIHCGDYCVNRKILDKYNINYVDGNCDIHSDKEDLLLEIDGKKIFVTHGHKYKVKLGVMNLYYKAMELGCDYVFYGHTHIRACFKENGIIFINPGSLKYGREYCVIENDEIIFKEI